MMQVIESLPPIVALVIGLVLLAWLVLVFLVPFMIESIRQSSRRTHEELTEMNAKLDRLNRLMAQRPSASDGGRGGETRGERAPAEERGADSPASGGRREPTISETDLEHEPRRKRREPVVR